jgi:hypothetical protein
MQRSPVITTAVPFICKKCGKHYGDDGGPGALGFQGDVSNVTIADIGMQCPRCGTLNRMAIPDGVYNVRGGRFEIVRSLARDILSARATADEIQRLGEVAKEANANGGDVERIASAIENETPFAKFAETIRKADREHPPGWIAYILAIILPYIISYVIAAVSSGNSPAPPTVAHFSEQQISQIAQQVANDIEKQQRLEQRGSLRQPGRNEACPCGSGIKYKKCCGDPVKRTASQSAH